MFVMISYFITFVYHILIYHFFYLPGFLKKKNYILFSKETVIFLYKIKFSGHKEIDFGYSGTCGVPRVGVGMINAWRTRTRPPGPPCTPACGCAPALQARSDQFHPTPVKEQKFCRVL